MFLSSAGSTWRQAGSLPSARYPSMAKMVVDGDMMIHMIIDHDSDLQVFNFAMVFSWYSKFPVSNLRNIIAIY